MVIIRVLLGIAPLAALAFTSLASATESVEFNSVEVEVYCRSYMSDGGYEVKIRPGSPTETARVSLGADSFVGVSLISTFDVSVTPSGSGSLFEGSHPSPYAKRKGGRQSRETSPDHLTLTLSEGHPRSDDTIEYDATLTAEIIVSINLPPLTVRDRLGCSSPRSQASPSQAR